MTSPLFKIVSLAGGAMMSATAAFASTVSISSYNPGSYPSVAFLPGFVSQDFEPGSYGGSVTGPEITEDDTFNVGTFRSIGGTGDGGAVDELTCADGSTLCLGNTGDGDGVVFGRTNVLPMDGVGWLDSNDTYGIVWDVSLPGDAAFDLITLTLQDATDVGAALTVFSADSEIPGFDGDITEEDIADAVMNDLLAFDFLAPNSGNGNIQEVVIRFDAPVTSAKVLFTHFETVDNEVFIKNDGFGLDGIRVGAEVPLPAGVWLLLSGLGALGVARRRRRT